MHTFCFGTTKVKRGLDRNAGSQQNRHANRLRLDIAQLSFSDRSGNLDDIGNLIPITGLYSSDPIFPIPDIAPRAYAGMVKLAKMTNAVQICHFRLFSLLVTARLKVLRLARNAFGQFKYTARRWLRLARLLLATPTMPENQWQEIEYRYAASAGSSRLAWTGIQKWDQLENRYTWLLSRE